ncbi:MAG: hypothetical protein QNJ54_33150 [Prochloraceae cyanobacterium]|nr:hypothetical protein [Prochloraceae cyanobacterium]
MSYACLLSDCFRQQSHVIRELTLNPLLNRAVLRPDRINEKFTPGIFLLLIFCIGGLMACKWGVDGVLMACKKSRSKGQIDVLIPISENPTTDGYLIYVNTN